MRMPKWPAKGIFYFCGNDRNDIYFLWISYNANLRYLLPWCLMASCIIMIVWDAHTRRAGQNRPKRFGFAPSFARSSCAIHPPPPLWRPLKTVIGLVANMTWMLSGVVMRIWGGFPIVLRWVVVVSPILLLPPIETSPLMASFGGEPNLFG